MADTTRYTDVMPITIDNSDEPGPIDKATGDKKALAFYKEAKESGNKMVIEVAEHVLQKRGLEIPA